LIAKRYIKTFFIYFVRCFIHLLICLDGGSFPVLGAPQLSAVDHEAKMVAGTAVKQLAEVTAVTGAACQHVQLIDILSLKKQVSLV
jgi:hypothetical protein